MLYTGDDIFPDSPLFRERLLCRLARSLRSLARELEFIDNDSSSHDYVVTNFPFWERFFFVERNLKPRNSTVITLAFERTITCYPVWGLKMFKHTFNTSENWRMHSSDPRYS